MKIHKRRTTTGRLREAARLIEAHPDHHDQRHWVRHRGIDVNRKPIDVARAPESILMCGTSACIAGWGAVVTPPDDADWRCASWARAGCSAFGVDIDAIIPLFYGKNFAASDAAAILRALADIPPGRRGRMDFMEMNDLIEATLARDT